MHYLFKCDFKMSSKLIVRGSDINYVNKNGKTAMHLCVENKNIEAIGFLIKKGANPHILDLGNEDCCDKAKSNGVAMAFWQFNNCNVNLKRKPSQLPDIDDAATKRTSHVSLLPTKTGISKDEKRRSVLKQENEKRKSGASNSPFTNGGMDNINIDD